MKFQLVKSKHEISLDPNSTSDKFIMNYEDPSTFIFDNDLLLLYSISHCSDTSGNYENNIGHTYGQKDLKTDNELIITLKDSIGDYPNDIFEVTFR